MVPFVLEHVCMEYMPLYCKWQHLSTASQWKKRYFFVQPFIFDSEIVAFFLKLVDAKMRLRKVNWRQESEWNGRTVICIRFVPLLWIQNCAIDFSPNNGTRCRAVEKTQEGARQWTAATERGKRARQFWPRLSVREGVTDDTDVGATVPVLVPREPILGLLDWYGSHAVGIYLGRLDDHDLGMLLILVHWLMATAI
jgi:hypothetical protein